MTTPGYFSGNPYSFVPVDDPAVRAALAARDGEIAHLRKLVAMLLRRTYLGEVEFTGAELARAELPFVLRETLRPHTSHLVLSVSDAPAEPRQAG